MRVGFFDLPPMNSCPSLLAGPMSGYRTTGLKSSISKRWLCQISTIPGRKARRILTLDPQLSMERIGISLFGFGIGQVHKE